MDNEKKLTKEWEVSAFDRVNNEWTTTMNHAYEPQVDIPDFTSQAPPIRISPTKRQRPDGDIESRHIFYGDTHFPFTDMTKLSLANLYVRETMPDTVVYAGDDLDMALFSRFESRSEWLTSTQTGIDGFSNQLARTRANIGADGKIVVHEGNHNVRFARELRKYNAELLGIKRANAESALGVLTLDYLLRCEEMGVEYISGYPSSEYWHEDDLKSYHGSKTNSAGLAVAKEIKEETVNFVHGHTHQAGIMYRTYRNGKEEKTIFGMEVGTFADPNDVPSGAYATTERGEVLRQLHNWQYGLGEVLKVAGVLIPNFIPITDQGILINNKWYKS